MFSFTYSNFGEESLTSTAISAPNELKEYSDTENKSAQVGADPKYKAHDMSWSVCIH